MFFYISAKLVIYAFRFKNLNFLFNFLNLRRLYLLEKIFRSFIFVHCNLFDKFLSADNSFHPSAYGSLPDILNR